MNQVCVYASLLKWRLFSQSCLRWSWPSRSDAVTRKLNTSPSCLIVHNTSLVPWRGFWFLYTKSPRNLDTAYKHPTPVDTEVACIPQNKKILSFWYNTSTFPIWQRSWKQMNKRTHTGFTLSMELHVVLSPISVCSTSGGLFGNQYIRDGNQYRPSRGFMEQWRLSVGRRTQYRGRTGRQERSSLDLRLLLSLGAWDNRRSPHFPNTMIGSAELLTSSPRSWRCPMRAALR